MNVVRDGLKSSKHIRLSRTPSRPRSRTSSRPSPTRSSNRKMSLMKVIRNGQKSSKYATVVKNALQNKIQDIIKIFHMKKLKQQNISNESCQVWPEKFKVQSNCQERPPEHGPGHGNCIHSLPIIVWKLLKGQISNGQI